MTDEKVGISFWEKVWIHPLLPVDVLESAIRFRIIDFFNLIENKFGRVKEGFVEQRDLISVRNPFGVEISKEVVSEPSPTKFVSNNIRWIRMAKNRNKG